MRHSGGALYRIQSASELFLPGQQFALEIIQRKIVSLLKSNKDIDVDTAKETLKTLVEEREKIYNLDEETIEKVYNIYLDEVKKGK